MPMAQPISIFSKQNDLILISNAYSTQTATRDFLRISGINRARPSSRSILLGVELPALAYSVEAIRLNLKDKSHFKIIKGISLAVGEKTLNLGYEMGHLLS